MLPSARNHLPNHVSRSSCHTGAVPPILVSHKICADLFGQEGIMTVAYDGNLFQYSVFLATALAQNGLCLPAPAERKQRKKSFSPRGLLAKCTFFLLPMPLLLCCKNPPEASTLELLGHTSAYIYICIHMYVYICIYIYIHMWVHIYTYRDIHAY